LSFEFLGEIKLPVHLSSETPYTIIAEDYDGARNIRHFGGRVGSAVLAIEQTIVEIIMLTVLSEVKNHRQLVIDALLKTSWCTLSAKRELLFAVIKPFELMINSEEKALEKHLRKVMDYRNAFAHGTIVHVGLEFKLNYFKAGKQSFNINKEFAEKVRDEIVYVWESLNKIEAQLKQA
jgi:hypothetical protein